MKTILAILKAQGELKPGFALKIENPPWMPLCIEDIQTPGPNGWPSLSVAHYGEQNGDAMRDPEMLFELVELDGKTEMMPYYFRNDYVGVEQYSSEREPGSGRVLVRPRLKAEHAGFARAWNRNLRAQRFLEASRPVCDCGAVIDEHGFCTAPLSAAD